MKCKWSVYGLSQSLMKYQKTEIKFLSQLLTAFTQKLVLTSVSQTCPSEMSNLNFTTQMKKLLQLLPINRCNVISYMWAVCWLGSVIVNLLHSFEVYFCSFLKMSIQKVFISSLGGKQKKESTLCQMQVLLHWSYFLIETFWSSSP